MSEREFNKIQILEKAQNEIKTYDHKLSKVVNEIEEFKKSALIFYKVIILVDSAREIHKMDLLSENDLFVTIIIGPLMQRTKKIENNSKPIWNESFSFFIDFNPDKIKFLI